MNWNIATHMMSCIHMWRTHSIPAMDCFVSGVLTPEERDRIDMVALHYRPNDIDQKLVPIKVYGDGNCFPRSNKPLCF